jgi:hypothetical protein
MPDGSVLVIGGLDGAGQPVRTLERFTLDAGFVAVGELPVGAGVIDGTATPLPDGRILLAGGRPEAGAAAVEVDSDRSPRRPQRLSRRGRHRPPGDPARRPPGGGAVRRHGAGGRRHAGGRAGRALQPAARRPTLSCAVTRAAAA